MRREKTSLKSPCGRSMARKIPRQLLHVVNRHVPPWEQIFYGEFDGTRCKRVLVKIIGE